MRTVLRNHGRSHDLVVEEAIVHLGGEFSGNIDTVLVAEPRLSKRDLLASLRIEVPGESDLIDVLGYRQTKGQWELTFFSEHIRENRTVPPSIEVYWGSAREIYLGTVPCRQATEADVELTPEAIYGPDVVRRAKVKGTLALVGLLLFFLATLYAAFPEVRDWVRGLVSS